MRENIYIFNVLNNQDHYAKCMELILSLEGDETIRKKSKEDWLELLSNMESQNIKIDIVFPQNNKVTGKPAIEKVKWLENDIVYHTPNNFEIYKERFAESLSNNSISKSKTDRYYYFRIHSNEQTDVVNFLYYALMLQSQGVPFERMIAFILPACDNTMIDNTGVCYLNAAREMINKTNQYNRFSDFLMLLPQNNIFGTWYDTENKKMQITKLENKKQKGILGYKNLPKSFIPLFPVDEKTYYDIIQVKHPFQSIEVNSNTDIEYEFLDMLGKVSEFNEKEGLVQDFFRFANDKLNSIFGKRNIVSHMRLPLVNALASSIYDNSGISAMQYLILALIIPRYANFFEEITNNDAEAVVNSAQYYSQKEKEWKIFWDTCFNEAYDFGDAVAQLFENAVNHSINHCGLATARLFDNKSTKSEHLLQIIIADSNREKNVINTFVNNSSKCPDELAKVCEDINISDFLTRIDDKKYWEERITSGYWKAFRKYNPETCQGLLKFSKHILKLDGIAIYRSSVHFNDSSDKYIWTYGTKADYEKSYIPGTQISFGLTQNKNEDVKYNDIPSVHNPIYEGYARYLDCNIPPILLNISDENITLQGQEKKDKLIEAYAKAWMDIVETNSEKLSINVDFSVISKMSNNSQYETIWKGFLKAIRTIKTNVEDDEKIDIKEQNIKYFAFTNMSIECFKHLIFTVKLHEERQLFKYVCVHMTNGRCIDLSQENWEDFLSSKYKSEILPFQLLSSENERDFFEKVIDEASENALIHPYGHKHGYKLSGTHMRLGSKVHLDTFYQMSTFFKKQDMAMHTAFVLSRQILEGYINDAVLNKGKRKLMLYGYESYSRTVLFCMSEMLKKYFQLKGIELIVEFAIYQVDRIVGSRAINEKPYFSIILNDNDENGIRRTLEEFSWVLIVPISSTLTTFKKMWSKIKSFYGVDEKHILATLTAFWVIDENNKTIEDNIIKPSDIESGFWKSADIIKKTIDMGEYGLRGITSYNYYMYKKSKWHSPFTCDKCYPENPINEVPLLETDPSSTVPEQQYYLQEETDSSYIDQWNDFNKFLSLKDCVSYGHIDKNGNHYQYYLNLPKYFQKNKENVRIWLESLRNKFETSFQNKTLVLVSPQQNTDIEFSLYVSNYLCNGNAISIMIDSDKHFRSNIEAEYADIKEILKDRKDVFYMYVDTSITSGKGIQRISSLMSNLAYSSPEHFAFDAVILLVNRLSLSSCQQYVIQKEMFQSFLNIKVPNLRTHGDSCVCCKLAERSDELYRKAATPQISAYFEAKKYKNTEVPFNEIEENCNDKGFVRLAIAHSVACELETVHSSIGDKNEIKGKYFDAIKKIVDAAMGEGNIPLISKVIEVVDEKYEKCCCLRHALKIMGRPFFSYVYNEKAVMIDILIILSELIFDSIISSNNTSFRGQQYAAQIKESMNRIIDSLQNKQYLLDRRDWLEKIAQDIISSFESFGELADFVCGCLFKLLMNLGSNYIIRFNTLYKVISFLSKNEDANVYEKFYKHYLRYIVNLLKSGQDESKSVRIEFMLRSGTELQEKQTLKDANMVLIDEFENPTSNIRKMLNNTSNEHIDYLLNNFVRPLIIENTQVLYKGLSDISMKFKFKDNIIEQKQAVEIIDKIPDDEFFESYINSMYQLLKSELNYAKNQGDNSDVCAEIKDLLLLYAVVKSGKKQSGDVYFASLKEALIKIICVDFNTNPENIYVSLFATKTNKNPGFRSESNQKIYGVTKEDVFDENQEAEIRKLLENDETINMLNSFGYFYQTNNDEQTCVIIKFNNNREALKGMLKQYSTANLSKEGIQEIISQKIEIDPVYIYIKLSKMYVNNYNYLFAIRKILNFRHSLVTVIEKDFSNNTMQQKYNAEIAAKLLTVDKAGSHLSNSEFMALQYYLQLSDTTDTDDFVSLEKSEDNTKWLLLYNYTNRRIARLYNKMLAVKYLSQTEELKKGYAETYVYSVDQEDSQALTNLGKAIKDRNRKSYFDTLEKVITFHVNGKKVKNTQELIGKLQDFDCIKLPSTTLYGHKTRIFYSAENFLVCGLLDFCYSAIKKFKNWNDFGLSGSNGIVGIFDYMNREGIKCDIYIESEYSADLYNGLEYGWLTFRDTVCKEEKENAIGMLRNEEIGMSISTICWYIDTLWECYDSEKFKPSSQPPKVSYSYEENEDDTITFCIKFPILKSKDKKEDKNEKNLSH